MLLSDIPAYAAHHKPDQVAIWFEDKRLTYTELRDRSWQLSNALLKTCSPGDRVAILSENCPEYVECYYGVPGAGMALTLLNYRLTGPELTYIIGNAEPRVLVVEPKYLPVIRQIRKDIPSVEKILLIGAEAEDCTSYDDFVGTGDAVEPSVRPSEDDLCWLIYTSGTTGLPKGAMLSHRNLMSAILNSAVSWDREPDAVYMFTFPQFHVAGYAMPLQHINATPVVLLRNFDAEVFLQNIERYKVTATGAAPTMIAMLLERPDIDRYDLSSLKNIGYGAAAMPAEVLRRTYQRWPQIEFGTGFGMTELAGNVMVLTAEDHKRALAEGLPILSSVGQQMPLAMVRVVDEDDNDVAPNEPGEIIIKGDQVLSGYWRNPEATEKSIVNGWFHSGDVGRWDENGYLYIVDRKKDMILSGGENIYPREVEEVLYQHPDVVEAAVIGVPDEKWGETVVAVLALRNGNLPSNDEIISFCKERIASYKKPKHIVFVEELPKNASGKILKRELRDRIADGSLSLS